MPPLADAHQFRSAADSHPIDRAVLARYLERNGLHLDDDVEILQFATGLANINYRLSIAGRLVVLRRPPDGELPPGAHDMRREHRVLARLHQALALAPQGLHLCEDTSVIGVPFQIIEYRPGLIIKGGASPHLDGKPDVCADLARMLVETLAAIHAVDVTAVGLEDFGRPEGFIARTIAGWRSRAGRLEPSRATMHLVSEIGDWLTAQRIVDRRPTLLHSDFKLDNVILDPETLAPRAIVDWDMATRGDPLFDLATLLSYWTQAEDPECMHRLDQMPTAMSGFPTRNEIVAMYAEATGIDVSDIPALRVLAIYKLAVVFLQLFALYGTGADARPLYAGFDRLGEDILLFAKDAAADA